ncbi:MAG: PD40 domain-containing protein [Phycisphaerales bacterium]|nr:MAG: PD40 domain-containing protein [Phycisphaerales bacterium]
MTKRLNITGNSFSRTGIAVLLLLLAASGAVEDAFGEPQTQKRVRVKRVPSSRAELNLADIPFKILFETYRRTDGRQNWELFQIDADGSNPINLTNTPDLDEMYAHASADGTKICFVADEGRGRRRLRNVYYMNIDGTERVQVARNARQPCWSPDGKTIAYLKGEYERYSTREYATAELFFYDLESGEHKPHPNRTLHHIYAICWSPDKEWFLGAVHGGMGYSDTILAFDADGTRVFDLARWGVKGCRPDISLDGTKIVWGETDWDLCMADIDLSGRSPRVLNVHKIVGCRRSKTEKVYHVDLSPDGKYVVFSFGPWAGGQQVGGKARGWNLCISDLSGKWVRITADGLHYKEPDWIPIRPANP